MSMVGLSRGDIEDFTEIVAQLHVMIRRFCHYLRQSQHSHLDFQYARWHCPS